MSDQLTSSRKHKQGKQCYHFVPKTLRQATCELSRFVSRLLQKKAGLEMYFSPSTHLPSVFYNFLRLFITYFSIGKYFL